jgi:hypothetical protein
MNNTDKLLRAFIEASGFEIEEIKGEGGVVGLDSQGKVLRAVITVDYEVTKKKVISFKCLDCGTHLGIGAPMNSCLCGSSDNLVEVN